MTTLGGTRPRTDSLAWLDHAACRGEDPGVFFPAQGHSARPAKKICATCPVNQPCLEEALANPYLEDHGIRGGTSRQERKAIRQRRRAQR